MKRIFLSVVFVLAILYFAWVTLSSPKGAQKVDYNPASRECGSLGKLNYCIYRAAQGTNGDIAYYLHGRNLDEKSWNDDTFYTSLIQKHWSSKSIQPPTIVAMSYGKVWLLSPKGQSESSGLLEDFRNDISQIEKILGAPKRRILFGESMGGLNTLIAGLNSEGFFSKLAALCPAVYKDSPFSPLSQMREFTERTGADPKIIFGILLLAKKYVANEAEWERISPLLLLNNVTDTSTSLYLSCGLYDKYGNFEGTELLAEKAASKGFIVDWRPLYGGHCAIDISSVADFLTK
jgi:hypothetical protein